MDDIDRSCVSHIKLGQDFEAPRPHRKGVERAFVVSCPYLTATVAYGPQIRVQLETDRLVEVSSGTLVYLTKHQLDKLHACLCVCSYPNFLQAFACPAVIDGHSAVFTPRNDVLVICS